MGLKGEIAPWILKEPSFVVKVFIEALANMQLKKLILLFFQCVLHGRGEE